MSALFGLQRIHRVVLSAIVAVALAAGLMVATPHKAEADPRNWLRPDATGYCEWDAVRHWVQRCDVFSPAMNQNITVQIMPATRGGNASLYLLDGLRATNYTNAWLHDVNAAATYFDSNIALVMPVGGTASFYADWQGPATYDLNNPVNYKWETFLTAELPGYLQQHFGISPTNNAVAGLSMGGTAAMNLAAKHPDMFRQALSFSGYLSTTIPGAQTLIRAALLDAGGYNINAMYGSIISPARFENDPLLNLGNLDADNVYISAASGIPSPADQGIAPQYLASGMALEIVANITTRLYGVNAAAAGKNVIQDYPATGVHNWNQFGYQLNKTKGLVLDTMEAW